MSSNKKEFVEPMPSELFGYKVTKFLGAGGMSLVYRVKDQGQNRNLAIKIPKVESELTENERQRFILEAKLMGQLQHPTIPPIYEISEKPGEVFYVMKQIRGRDLRSVLKGLQADDTALSSEFSRFHLLSIFVSVCQAIAFCHTRGVIHRDLKPENIMIGDFAEVQVIDFGLAKAFGRNLYSGDSNEETIDSFDTDQLILETATLSTKEIDLPDDEVLSTGETSYIEEQTLIFQSTDGLTKEGKVMGTLVYMSPEQAQGDIESHNHTTDIYSLGVVLWDILIGSHLRKGSNVKDYLKQAASGRRPNIDKLHLAQRLEPELKKILLKATEPFQGNRYQSAKELGDEIQWFLDGKRKWKMVYEQDFSKCEDTKSTPEGWIAHDGEWAIKKGALAAIGDKFNNIIHLDQNIYGDLRLEFTASLEGEGEIASILMAPETPLSKVKVDGYFFEYGADYRQHSKIARQGQDVVFEPGKIPELNQKINITVEVLDGVLQMECDQNKILNYHDLLPLKGSRIGFYSFTSALRIYSVKVFLAGASRFTPYITVPDALFQNGFYHRALEEYTRLIRSFPGSDQANQALYKSILCELKLKNEKKAITLIEKLKSTDMAPMAYLALSQLKELAFEQSHDEGCLEAEKELLIKGVNNIQNYYVGTEQLLQRLQDRANDFELTERYPLAIELWITLSKLNWLVFDRKIYALWQYLGLYLKVGGYEKVCEITSELPDKIKKSTYGWRLIETSFEAALRLNKINFIHKLHETESYKHIHKYKASAYHHVGRFELERVHLLKILDKKDIQLGWSTYLYHYCVSFLMNGYFDECRLFVEEIAQENPNNKYSIIFLNLWLSRIKYYLKDFEGSLEHLKLIKEKCEITEIVYAYTLSAYILVDKEQFPELLNLCDEITKTEKIITEQSHKIQLLIIKANIYFYLNENELSRGIYQDCISQHFEIKIEIGDAWLGLIRLNVKAGDSNGALKVCLQCLEQSPYNYMALHVFIWSRLLKESLQLLEKGFFKEDIQFFGIRQYDKKSQLMLIYQCFNCPVGQWEKDERNIELNPIELLKRIHSKEVFIELIDFRATYDNEWLPYASDKKIILTPLEAWDHFQHLKEKFNYQDQE
ncbi:MAG: hypothetical protein COA79_23520 [Planctomycetota bacterium]|nr:MAG: hypothetical protein COA79_23520 [Planctomycetota bacterium]